MENIIAWAIGSGLAGFAMMLLWVSRPVVVAVKTEDKE